MQHDTIETAWNIDAVRRLDALFEYIERAVAHAMETDRILTGCPLR